MGVTITKWEDVKAGDELGFLGDRWECDANPLRGLQTMFKGNYSVMYLPEDKLQRACDQGLVTRPDPKALEPHRMIVPLVQTTNLALMAVPIGFAGRDVVILDLTGGEWEYCNDLNPGCGRNPRDYEGYVRRKP